MRAALRVAVVAVPVLALLLLMRACAGGEGERWLARARDVDPGAKLVVDDDDLIVVAPDPSWGVLAEQELRPFRDRLVEEQGDLLGRPADRRMVVVLFPSGDDVRAFAKREYYDDPGRAERVHGYTDPMRGAIFLPAEADRATLRHETVHWVMETAVRGQVSYSPWLLEGLAQLFETDPPGRLGPMQRRALRPELDVDRLLDLQDYRAFVMGEGARNYLESLALVSFLFHERPRSLFVRYVDTERRAESQRAAWFRQLFDSDSGAFRQDLRTFVAALRAGR